MRKIVHYQNPDMEEKYGYGNVKELDKLMKEDASVRQIISETILTKKEMSQEVDRVSKLTNDVTYMLYGIINNNPEKTFYPN